MTTWSLYSPQVKIYGESQTQHPEDYAMQSAALLQSELSISTNHIALYQYGCPIGLSIPKYSSLLELVLYFLYMNKLESHTVETAIQDIYYVVIRFVEGIARLRDKSLKAILYATSIHEQICCRKMKCNISIYMTIPLLAWAVQTASYNALKYQTWCQR